MQQNPFLAGPHWGSLYNAPQAPALFGWEGKPPPHAHPPRLLLQRLDLALDAFATRRLRRLGSRVSRGLLCPEVYACARTLPVLLLLRHITSLVLSTSGQYRIKKTSSQAVAIG